MLRDQYRRSVSASGPHTVSWTNRDGKKRDEDRDAHLRVGEHRFTRGRVDRGYRRIGGRAAREAGKHEEADGRTERSDSRRNQRKKEEGDLRHHRRPLPFLDLRFGPRSDTKCQLLRLLQSLSRGLEKVSLASYGAVNQSVRSLPYPHRDTNGAASEKLLR